VHQKLRVGEVGGYVLGQAGADAAHDHALRRIARNHKPRDEHLAAAAHLIAHRQRREPFRFVGKIRVVRLGQRHAGAGHPRDLRSVHALRERLQIQRRILGVAGERALAERGELLAERTRTAPVVVTRQQLENTRPVLEHFQLRVGELAARQRRIAIEQARTDAAHHRRLAASGKHEPERQRLLAGAGRRTRR